MYLDPYLLINFIIKNPINLHTKGSIINVAYNTVTFFKKNQVFNISFFSFKIQIIKQVVWDFKKLSMIRYNE